MLNQQEIRILRELAAKYADIAALPVQNEKRRLWLKLNHIQMERPLLLIDQIPWSEMDVDGSLICQVQDPYWRKVEWEMRTTLYKWQHMPADMVVNPYLCLPRPIHNTRWGISSETSHKITQEHANSVTSRAFICQFEDPEDVEKIKMPVITLDRDLEEKIIRTAHDLFDGIIDFRMIGKSLHLGLWDFITGWMGVSNCYIELIDRPEMMHAIMERMTQTTISMIHQLNELEAFDIYSNMTHCSHTFMKDMPKEGDRALSGNAWGYGLAQLFTSVSPEITNEFEVAYMKRIFPYFGAIYYGCCDRLDDRLHYIRNLPKIRKLSCSPWSVREAFAEKMPDYCVMSNKPNPAFVSAGQLNEDVIRNDVRHTIAAAKSCGRSLELILKDISTVKHNPACLWRWQEIVMEELQR